MTLFYRTSSFSSTREQQRPRRGSQLLSFLVRRFHEIGLNQRLLAGAIHQGPLLAELENNIFPLLGLGLPKAHNIHLVSPTPPAR